MLIVRIRICPICGKEFTPKTNALVCSPSCRKAFEKEKRNKSHKSVIGENKNANAAYMKRLKENSKRIVAKNEEARAKGLSYGQLQAKKWLAEHRLEV